MKTAEQWAMNNSGVYHDARGDLAGIIETHVGFYIEAVKIIQLDAFKAGMSRAADIVNTARENEQDASHRTLLALPRKTILTTRDNIKIEEI